MKGKKTLSFAGLLMALGVLEAADWTTLLDEKTAGWVAIGIAAAVAYLRVVTDTPVGKKE